MKRVAVVAALCAALVGGSVAVARPAVAQEEGPNNSGLVLCIGRALDLFLIDIPEETQLIGIWVSDDFQCPSEGFG